MLRIGRIHWSLWTVMSSAPHLLVVDDDREIRDLLSSLLGRRGYRVNTAEDERAMRRFLAYAKVELIILDVMLPGMDGLAICRELRSSSETPIIMLTARGETTDRIVGLEMGADDYLAKPFDVHELEARIKAVLRRRRTADHAERDAQCSTLEFEGWKLQLRQRQLVSPAGALVDLSFSEFELLSALAERSQRVLSRDQLLDITSGRESSPFDRSVDIRISRLRRKIEPDPRKPSLIKTIRSGGYMFVPTVVRT